MEDAGADVKGDLVRILKVLHKIFVPAPTLLSTGKMKSVEVGEGGVCTRVCPLIRIRGGGATEIADFEKLVN